MSDRLNRLQRELEAIHDPQDRAKAISAVLAGIPDFQKGLRERRQADLLALHTTHGMSYGQIGALLGITRGRAKQVIDGQTVSGRYLNKNDEKGAPTE